jgi:hypothetical protein
VSQEEAEGSAEKIINQHPLATGSPHFLQQSNRFFLGQVMEEQRTEDDIPLAIDLVGEHFSLIEPCRSMLLAREFRCCIDCRAALVPTIYLTGDSPTIQLLPQLNGDVSTPTCKVQNAQGATQRMAICPSYDRLGKRRGGLAEIIDPA